MPTKKVSDNFSMAEPVHTLFQSFSGPKGSKTKWIAGTAAIIALARLSPEERSQLMRDVAVADVTDGYETLLPNVDTSDRSNASKIKSNTETPTVRVLGEKKKKKKKKKQ